MNGNNCLFVGGLFEVLVGRFAVDGVDHYHAWLYFFHRFEPWVYEVIARIIYVLSFHFATHKHGLNDAMTVEQLHIINDFTHIIGRAYRAVNERNVFWIDGVELQNVVVHEHQCLSYVLMTYHRSVAEHGDFSVREIGIADADGVLDDVEEVWMCGRLTVSCKCKDVGCRTLLLHFLEFSLQSLCHDFACRALCLRNKVLIVSTFAVDAVESAGFTIARLQVYA